MPISFRLTRPTVRRYRSASDRSRLPLALLIALFACLLPEQHARAQEPSALAPALVVQGTVRDAATGDPLPAATVQVAGTYRGTITNADGSYELAVDALPATLEVRFIGYETAARALAEGASATQDIALQPVAYELDEIVVSGEDPAVQIMREVIRRKQTWRQALETYKADVYNRFTLANDTGIVSIIESLTEAYWDRDEGLREVVKDRRQTANLNLPDALPAALFVTNLYDDNIDVAGHTLRGVTHPDALDHYRFRLEGTRRIDDQRVYDLTVEPRNRLKSGFEGRLAVLDSVYALLDVELRPSEAFRFPPPIQGFEVTYRQQFSPFGGEIWLPADFRSTSAVDIGIGGLLVFPTIEIDQVSRFSNYAVNVPLPDSLFDRRRALVDSVAVREADLLERPGAGVPLSLQEQAAYATIDSTMGLDQAYAPTGLAARFVNLSGSSDEDGVSVGASGGQERGGALQSDVEPELWYNRVDGLHLGLDGAATLADRLRLGAFGGYSFGLAGDEPMRFSDASPWAFGGSARALLGPAYMEGRYENRTAPTYRTDRYSLFTNSASVLLGGADYFDYFRHEGWAAEAGWEWVRWPASAALTYRDEDHQALPRTTSYDLLGEEPLRLNRPVVEGRLRSVAARIEVGERFNLLQVFGSNRAVLEVEHSSDALGSDFDFTRARVALDGRLPTFFRRRFQPNVLDVRLTASAATDDVPPQRLGTVDGSLGLYRPFGVLHTRQGTPYVARRTLGLFWEHNFRTVPFEVLGLDALAERSWNLLVFGGHATTSDEAFSVPPNVQTGDFVSFARPIDGWHHEVGVGVSGLFGILRVDAAKRLDAGGFTVGLGVARLF